MLDVTGGGTPTRASQSTTAAFNPLNQVTAQSPIGLHRFTGTVPGLAKVTATVGSNDPVTLPVSDPPGSTDKPFAGWVGVADGDDIDPIPTGAATVTIDAEDYGSPSQEEDEVVSMTVVAGANKSFVYDDNGNTISITDHATSETTTFEWDAADQLRRIEYHDGTATEFQYDAMGRRVRLIEWEDSDPQEETSNKYFLWDGLFIAEERSAPGAFPGLLGGAGDRRRESLVPSCVLRAINRH